ncbi:MAG TPA: RHS repeat-associated core domain-containing protein, partial [Thermoanaerobaculaceae bacterium]|nr:RHS repeat-associated core domain-containing protein [Thermoanaerobaculaceae bacterium]
RDYAGSMQFAFGYTYDRQDRPTMTVLPDASSISYVYDGAQLSQAYSVLWYAGGGFAVDAAVYGLDAHPSGGLTSLTFLSPAFGNQPAVQSSYSYGAGDQRLASATTVTNPFGAPQVIQQLLYTYDTAGNLRRSDALNQIDQDFAYDVFHRLAEVDTLGTLSYGSETYAYDDAGNLTYKGPAETAGQLRLRYDRTSSQPTHLSSVDVRQAGGSWLTGFGSYAIDNDGGITQRTKDSQLTTFWRNDAGQAQVVGIPAAWQTATYHYDATGQRSEKLVTGAFGVVDEARYAVDASFEVDTFHTTHEVHLFIGGRRVATSERSGLGNGVLPESLLSVTTYHPDQVGTNTVTTRTTATSQTVSKTILDPFGQKRTGTGSDPRHLFTDQERDAETGLDYFGARFYDAWVGRFLEQDPELGGATAGVSFARIEGDAGNLNAYAYALNQPTALIDPTGAFAADAGIGGAFDGASAFGFGTSVGSATAGGGEEGVRCGVDCEFPDPDERLPRPDGESRDPRGKGLPSSLPNAEQGRPQSTEPQPFYRGWAVNADAFSPVFGIGYRMGFTNEGRLYTRVRIGRGSQFGLSLVRVTLPNGHMTNGGFVAVGGFLEAEGAIGIPGTPIGADWSFTSWESGLVIPADASEGGVPFGSVSGPNPEGVTAAGFDVGISYGGEFIFVGDQKH